MRSFRYSTATHVGNVRTVNEDRLLALPEHGVWLVADGMGGHDAGDFAAQTIIDCVAMMARGEGLNAQAEALQDAILAAHDIIQDASRARGRGPIGAAVVALVAADDRFSICWAGDSRLYRVHDSDLEMVTTDHSVVADLVSAGQLTWEQAVRHPHSNVITRAVGVDATLELDVRKGAIQSGDRLMLCTDGLSNFIDRESLRRLLSEAPIAEAADQLIGCALDNGGEDNVSVIVIDVI